MNILKGLGIFTGLEYIRLLRKAFPGRSVMNLPVLSSGSRDLIIRQGFGSWHKRYGYQSW